MTDRDEPSNLKGSLAEIFFSSLLSGERSALSKRLGAKASLDAPGSGKVMGLAELDRVLATMEKDLTAKKTTWKETCFLAGFDRDVSCGELTAGDAKTPVAVVGERRPAREIEVRVYRAAKARGAIVPPSTTLLLPRTVSDVLHALKSGSADAAGAFFEEASSIHDSSGVEHTKQSGALLAYLGTMCKGGFEVERGGTADDGRRAAFECSLVKAWGTERNHDAALFVFERGDSGLFAGLRIFA